MDVTKTLCYPFGEEALCSGGLEKKGPVPAKSPGVDLTCKVLGGAVDLVSRVSSMLSVTLRTKRPLKVMALYPYTINPYMVYEP